MSCCVWSSYTCLRSSNSQGKIASVCEDGVWRKGPCMSIQMWFGNIYFYQIIPFAFNNRLGLIRSGEKSAVLVSSPLFSPMVSQVQRLKNKVWTPPLSHPVLESQQHGKTKGPWRITSFDGFGSVNQMYRAAQIQLYRQERVTHKRLSVI